MFAHLFVRSGYSLMESTIHVDRLARHAKELGFKELALVDNGVLHGTVPFIKACMASGIKPIIGMNVLVEKNERHERIVLLAENMDGYHALIRLSTRLQTDNELITFEEMEGLSSGLIGIFPVGESSLAPMLENSLFEDVQGYAQEWTGLFKEGNFYFGADLPVARNIELMRTLNAFAKFIDVEMMALPEVRYLEQSDAEAFHCLQAMEAGQKFQKDSFYNAELFHLRTAEEMDEMFAEFKDALDLTGRVAARCNVQLDFNRQMLPSYPVEAGKSAHAYLRERCEDNFHMLYKSDDGTARTRMEYELGIIEEMRFSDYFLIVWDFIAYAKREGIMVGPGRGSAAGSLVAYVLGITEVDPLKYNLLFERFLNPERVTMPDIDVDFSDQRRDEVIHYVKEKYGSAHVAQIITFGTFAARSLIRELVKTLDISDQDLRFILKEMSKLGSMGIIDYARQSQELKNYILQAEPIRQLFKIAAKLEGLPRHISTHAAGIVISEEPLVTHVPLISGSNEMMLTQFPMNDLEAVGLLKMDFLGLRNLSMIERMLASIRYTNHQEIDLKQLPKEDKATFQLLQEGRTNGIFQLESSGMKRVLRDLKPTSFEDIVAVNALYRPGPMEYIPDYIKRKHGQEQVVYPHPDLEPILRDTYGVLVYQEQIMQIANKIAGFSLGRADILRRAVSKKKKETIEEQQEAFIKGCLSKGYSADVANEIFEWIVRFSNYGFNKSHAVAYSEIAYQLSYLKAHYPASFFAELMSSVTGNHEKLAAYIKEARGLGMNVLAPSINNSFGFFTAENGQIRMGLNAIKSIGHQVAKEIIRARKEAGPFKDLFNFCLRVDMKLITRGLIETLVIAGAFDDLYPNRATMLASIDSAMEQGELFGDLGGQDSFFYDELEANYTEMEDFNQVKKLQDEKELLGVYISSHPLKKYRERLKMSGFVSIADAKDHVGKRNTKTCAILQSMKVIRTKNGEPMAFLTLSDETEEIEAVMFPETYRNTNRFLEEDIMIFVSGKVELRKDALQWLLNDVAPFDESLLAEQKRRDKLYIKLENGKNEREALQVLSETAKRYQGHVPILFYHEEKKRTYQLQEIYHMDGSLACVSELERFFGPAQVVLKKDS